jgi:drug/metabolite transporter (DMT)-like permease
MVSVLGLLMVFIAVSTWGLSSVGYKLALGTKGTVERDPITSLGFRNLIVLLFLTPLLPFLGDMTGLFTLPADIRGEYWFFAFTSGLADLVGHACYFYALRYLDSSRVYPFVNFQMVMTYPIAIYVFGEAVPAWLWLASILIIVGVSFVGKPDSKDRGLEKLSGEQRREHYIKGSTFGLLTGACFAMFYLSMTVQGRIWGGEWESNYSRLLMSVITIWIYIAVRPKHHPHFTTPEQKNQVKAYVMTGLFACLSAGIGDAVYQIGVQKNGSAISITIASIAPLINQFLAILLLKEKFRPRFLIGVLCIIVGNILVIL